MLKKLPITVIIPVSDDPLIEKCVESIDEPVDILIVLNKPSFEVKKIVKRLNVKKITIKERNLGAALQEGIEKSKTEKVLLMDSDCIFEKGTIKKLYQGLSNNLIANGIVKYKSNGFISKIIHKVRQFNAPRENNAYKPPLAIRKSVKWKIGGYYFDKDIFWEEDDELNDRVNKAKIPINFLDDAVVWHPPLTIYRDLRSAFRYGTGRRRGVKKKIFEFKPLRYINFKILKEGSLIMFIYLLIWNISYLMGYYFQKYFLE